ncbi:3641_t:CDS:2, partial [Dentiscutata erythropus]
TLLEVINSKEQRRWKNWYDTPVQDAHYNGVNSNKERIKESSCHYGERMGIEKNEYKALKYLHQSVDSGHNDE